MAGRGGSCCWGGNVLLLYLGFFGGSWGHSKVLVSGPAADHVFSPAPSMLTQKETFLISLLRGIFKSCSFVFQPSKEEANEEKTEDNLTTLFPGQKRRISHLVKQGNVSADLEADV